MTLIIIIFLMGQLSIALLTLLYLSIYLAVNKKGIQFSITPSSKYEYVINIGYELEGVYEQAYLITITKVFYHDSPIGSEKISTYGDMIFTFWEQ